MRRAASRRPAARRAARPSLVIGALFLSMILSACDFIGLDMFPPELQNLEASFDLRSALSAQGVSIKHIVKIERLVASNGAEYLFVLFEDGLSRKLSILDGGLNRHVATRSDGYLGPLMMADGIGNIICGQLRFDVATETFTQTFNDLDLLGDSRHGFWDPSLANAYVAFSPSSTQLERKLFSAGFSAAGSSSGAQNLFSLAPADSYSLADILYTGASTPFYLLFFLTNQGDSPYVMRFPTVAAFHSAMSSPPLENWDDLAYRIDSRPQDRRAWLTPDGIVVFESDRESRLVRYDLATGKELDSRRIDSEWRSGISLDPSGDYWYYYDSYTGMLNKLRTWWK